MLFDIGSQEEPDTRPPDQCEPGDIALKSFFLGPQSENADWFGEVFNGVLTAYFSWRRRMYQHDGTAISDGDIQTPQFQRRRRQMIAQMQQLLQRFEGEVPKFSPRYIGHMFSETSLPAMIGHVITLLHNPNNVSGEASRVGVQIEREAVEELAGMLGFDEGQPRGHFTSGGTVANFEAMVRARRRMERFIATGARARSEGLDESTLFEAAHMGWERYDELYDQLGDDTDLSAFWPTEDNPYRVAARINSCFGTDYQGPVVLVPAHKHYSWTKGVQLTGLGAEAFWTVDLNEQGMVCIDSLTERIEQARQQQRPVMMVVSVAGTTELGTFDPIDRIQQVLDDYRSRHGVDIYHHVDAAYGGFFAANVCGDTDSCNLGDGVCRAIEAIPRANSVTLDPHKLGYVPYASGAFVCADAREYFANDIDAPYVAFEPERDPGPQTIEGSRSAAGAVATWLTARTVGLNSDGYGRILRRTLRARQRLEAELNHLNTPVRIIPSQSNILSFCIARDDESLSETNRRTQRIYEAFSPQRNGEFFVSKTTLRRSEYRQLIESFVQRWDGQFDEDQLVLIRLCVMNPFIDSRETNTNFPRAFARAVERQVMGTF